jgi:c-di-GMP-binding flagellar brake protein YcgR
MCYILIENMINQRRHKRVPITGTVTLKFKDKGEFRLIQAVPGSISLGGIGLYADDQIEDETDVLITINFISLEDIKTDSIEGCVVYSKNMGGIHFMGIRFNEEVNPENHTALYEYILKILTWDK